MNATLLSRYQDRLRGIPQPGEGRHKDLLGIANLGIMAGLPPEDIHEDIRRTVSVAPMPDREIGAAVLKAAAEHHPGATVYRFPPRPAATR